MFLNRRPMQLFALQAHTFAMKTYLVNKVERFRLLPIVNNWKQPKAVQMKSYFMKKLNISFIYSFIPWRLMSY